MNGRPDGRATPAWATARGWSETLVALSDDEVRRVERDGLAHAVDALRLPSDLTALAHEVRRLTELPALDAASPRASARRLAPRKDAQVAAVVALVQGLDLPVRRVVDVGAGHGHLTRRLAHALGVPAEGWELDADRVAVARGLSGDGVAFVATDARGPRTPERLADGDLLSGLHACGALGDGVVELAAARHLPLVLVGCCLQKREGARVPLASDPALTLSRDVLGLGNARDGEDGVEEGLDARTEGRLRRAELRALFRLRGFDLAPGEELRGQNRRRTGGTLAALAATAFALRGLAAPTDAELRDAEREGREDHARARRHALPRTMLARLVEIWVAIDRAMHLVASGHDAALVEAFSRDVSPRNVALVATPR